jgi:hypothetical protein
LAARDPALCHPHANDSDIRFGHQHDHLARGAWSQILALTDLPEQIAFDWLQKERFSVHAAYYEDDVQALEGVARGLRGSSAPYPYRSARRP